MCGRGDGLVGLALGRKRVQGWILWGLFVGVRLWRYGGGVCIWAQLGVVFGYDEVICGRGLGKIWRWDLYLGASGRGIWL